MYSLSVYFIFVFKNMDMHANISASTNHKEHLSPNPTFSSWFKSRSLFYITPLIAVISSIYLFPAIYHYSHESWDSLEKFFVPQNTYRIIYCLNIAFALLFIYKLVNAKEQPRGFYRSSMVYRKIFNERPHSHQKQISLRKTEKILQRFKTYFIIFWVTMVLLYLLLYSDVQLPDGNSTMEWQRGLLIYGVNILNALCIFLCFVLFNSPPITLKDKKKYRKDINLSFFIAAVLIVLYPVFYFNSYRNNSEYYSMFHNVMFYSISGVVYGVSLALFIARLDSKLIGLPSGLIGVLYVYAVIQPLFITFEIKKIPFKQGISPNWENIFNVILASAMIISLVLKIYFFLIVRYAMDTGKIFNYLFCMPILAKRVDTIFNNNFEIFIERNTESNKHSFYFQIKKDNAPVYTTDFLFDTREQCLDSVLALRKAMEQEHIYAHKETEGMLWVEVLWPDKSIACISHNLHSKTEALSLIMESIEEIPYCKINYTSSIAE